LASLAGDVTAAVAVAAAAANAESAGVGKLCATAVYAEPWNVWLLRC
jgi:hypothetical protein